MDRRDRPFRLIMRWLLACDERQRAGWISGFLCLSCCLPYPLMRPGLPARVDVHALDLVMIASAVTGMILPLLPWRRLPHWVTLTPPLWGSALLGLGLGAYAGLLASAAVVITLGCAYWGLTQRPGVCLAMMAPTAALLAFAFVGNEPRSDWVELFWTLIVSTVLGEALAHLVDGQRRLHADLEQVLATVDVLDSADDLREAASQTADLVQRLVGADLCTVLLCDPTHPRVLVQAGHSGFEALPGSVVVDLDSGPTAAEHVLDDAGPLFISDVSRAPGVAQRLFAEAGAHSALWLPVPGEGGRPQGVIVVMWEQRLRLLDAASEHVARIVARHAGNAFIRLRRVADLQQRAECDPLTGLANRAALDDALGLLDGGGALVLVDLDHFKRVNDQFGHQAGDLLLARFATELRASVREGDLVARYGGEEFAVVLPRASRAAAVAVMDRMRRRWSHAATGTTFSAGVALHVPRDSGAETLARADAALYAAKRAGRDRVDVAA